MEKKSFVYIKTPEKEIIIRSIDKKGRKLIAVKSGRGIKGCIIGLSFPKSA